MVKAFRAAVAAYKKSRHEEKEQSRLIRKDIDYTYLKKLLQSLAEDQQRLMIVVKLANGTQLEIRRETKPGVPQRDPYIEEIQ